MTTTAESSRPVSEVLGVPPAAHKVRDRSFVLLLGGLTSVALHPSLFDPCLEGAGFDRFENLESEMSDSFSPAPRNEIADLIMAELRELTFDGEGRIVLPDEFIAKSNLKDQATFIGQGRKFQIWEPAALAAVMKAKLQRVTAAVKNGDT